MTAVVKVTQGEDGVVVTEETSQGSITILIGTEYITIPVPLRTVYTDHPDGRRDCVVHVPRLSTQARAGSVA